MSSSFQLTHQTGDPGNNRDWFMIWDIVDDRTDHPCLAIHARQETLVRRPPLMPRYDLVIGKVRGEFDLDGYRVVSVSKQYHRSEPYETWNEAVAAMRHYRDHPDTALALLYL